MAIQSKAWPPIASNAFDHMSIIYINIHIPKKAGTTFNGILRRLFNRQYVDVGEERPGQVLSTNEKVQVLAKHAHARCFSSHSFRHSAPPVPNA